MMMITLSPSQQFSSSALQDSTGHQ